MYGAVNIPVDLSYPLPWLVISVSKMILSPALKVFVEDRRKLNEGKDVSATRKIGNKIFHLRL